MLEMMIRELKNNDGLTLKKNVAISYKSGWQVADTGVECKTIEETLIAVSNYGGTCGIWFADGIYYVDHSFRVNTKREAMEIGRKYNQISVLNWRTMGLAYC